MSSLIRQPEFRRGVRDMVAPSLGIAAWGLVTGVAMVKSGLSVPTAAAMSVLVNAGSAQLAALPLLVAGAPLWVLWPSCGTNMIDPSLSGSPASFTTPVTSASPA